MPNYGQMLAQQAGAQAAGGIIDMVFQPWRNENQLKQNQKLIDQQIAAQKQMGMFNVERQIDLWNRTNAQAQMDHYKKAGLNPALMYEGGGPGGATNAAAGNVGQASADAKPGGGYTGMNILTATQAKLMEAQARNLDADTAKKSGVDTQLGITTIDQIKAQTTNVKAQTTLTKIQAGIAEIQKQIAEASQEDITDALSLTASNLQQQYFQLKNQTDISDQTKATIINTVKQNLVNTILQGMLTKSGIQLNTASINKMAQDIVQRGMEIDIKTFEAEIQANQPGIGQVSGSILNSIKNALDKFAGFKDTYTSPRKIRK